MQTDDVRAAEKGIEVGAVFDPEVAGFLQVEGARPGNDGKAEGVGAFDDFAADLADADDAERFAEEAVGFAEFFFVPFVGAEGGDVVGEAAVESENERKEKLGDRDGIFAGAIGDVHAAGAGGFDVDGVHARAGADDDGELVTGLDRVGGDLFTADDEDLIGSDEFGKVLGFDGGVVGDIAAEILESVEMVFGELVGNQYLHDDLPRGEGMLWAQHRAGRRWLASVVAPTLQSRNGVGQEAEAYACNAVGEPVNCAVWK